MATVVFVGNTRALNVVRDAVNTRARNVGASDETRRRAVSRGLTLVKFGRSTACAIAEACRELRASPSPSLFSGPTPPAAA